MGSKFREKAGTIAFVLAATVGSVAVLYLAGRTAWEAISKAIGTVPVTEVVVDKVISPLGLGGEVEK